MEQDVVQSSTSISLRTFVVQYFHMRYVYSLEDLDIAHCTHDSTPYCVDKRDEFFVSDLEQSLTILFEWLNNKYMEVNNCQNHLLLSGNSRVKTIL